MLLMRMGAFRRDHRQAVINSWSFDPLSIDDKRPPGNVCGETSRAILSEYERS
jgi:hypothetical protein